MHVFCYLCTVALFRIESLDENASQTGRRHLAVVLTARGPTACHEMRTGQANKYVTRVIFYYHYYA